MSQMPIESAAQEAGLGSWDRRDNEASQLEELGHGNVAQASMFDVPVDAAGLEAYSSSYERVETASYDPMDDFSQVSAEIDLEDVTEQEATSFVTRAFPERSSEHGFEGATTAESFGETASAPVQEPAVEAHDKPASGNELVANESSATSSPTEDALHGLAAADAAPKSVEAQANTKLAVTSKPTQTPSSESVTVLTVDDFAALEERILRTAGLVKREREARMLAESRVAALESEKLHFKAQSVEFETQCQGLQGQLRELESQNAVLERLEREVDHLRIEREQVRQRVERLLGQLDALEL